MKNLFSNKDLEESLGAARIEIAQLKARVKGLHAIIEGKDDELKASNKLLYDARTHDAQPLVEVAAAKELSQANTALVKLAYENQDLRSELAKAIRTRDNTKSAFERVKKQRDRLKAVQSVN